MFVKKYYFLLILFFVGQCFGLPQTQPGEKHEVQSSSGLDDKANLELQSFLKKADHESLKKILYGSTYNVEFFKIVGLVAMASVLFSGALGAASAEKFDLKHVKDNVYKDANFARYAGLVSGLCLALACRGGSGPKLKAKDALLPSLIALCLVASASLIGGEIGWPKTGPKMLKFSKVKPAEIWAEGAMCLSTVGLIIYFLIKRHKTKNIANLKNSDEMLKEFDKSYTKTRLLNFKETRMPILLELLKQDQASKKFMKIAPVIVGIVLTMFLPEIVKNMPTSFGPKPGGDGGGMSKSVGETKAKEEQLECPICLYQETGTDKFFLQNCPCKGWYHFACLAQCDKCPTCRKPFALENIVAFDPSR